MSPGKYEIAGSQAECEPGSRDLVLKNLLGITDPEEMEEAESRELVRATGQVLDSDQPGHQFTADDVRYLHRLWLEPIYPWAGEYRSVNVSKNGFPFASAHAIPTLMEQFEQGPLQGWTPCEGQGPGEHAEALAVTHAELILIHPFREGNGRCARLLALAMSVQAGYGELDFTPMDEDIKGYVDAVHAAMDRDYNPMRSIFDRVLERSERDAT